MVFFCSSSFSDGFFAVIEREKVASRAMFHGDFANSGLTPRRTADTHTAKLGTKANCVECKALFVSLRAIKTKGGVEKIVKDRYCSSCWKISLAASRKAKDKKEESSTKPDSGDTPANTGGVSGCRGFIGAVNNQMGGSRREPGGCCPRYSLR